MSSDSDQEDDYPWFSNPDGYGTEGDFRRTSHHSSQQQQQQSDEIGLGGIVVGTAAVLAVGAAAFGLFSAFRRARQNNQQ